MITQQIIILVLFLAAAGYIGWRFWKAFDSRNGGGCAKGCGCAADKNAAVKA
jgi:hypothetical protein